LGVDEDEVFACLKGPTRLRPLIERVVLTYAARRSRGDVRVWVDHTPLSLFILPYLQNAFPDARFLHLIRDGRAVGASVLMLHWGPTNILEAARSWSRQVVAGLAAETSSIFEGRIRRVCYENLVSDPLTTVASLCEFCEIRFEESMIDGEGFSVARHAQDQHRLVGTPPQASRADNWKLRLSARQIEIFEAEAGGLLQLLGYPTAYWPRAAPRTRYEAWLSRLRKFLFRPYDLARRLRRSYIRSRHLE
jgi:hypothetical protein